MVSASVRFPEWRVLDGVLFTPDLNGNSSKYCLRGTCLPVPGSGIILW